MGKREADMDGIKYRTETLHGYYGNKDITVFLVPCSRCGRIVKRRSYGRNQTYICDYCRTETKKKKEQFVAQLYDTITTKEERRFDKAVDNIRRQVKDFGAYEQDVEIARRGQFKYGSVPEAITAIELIHLGYSIIPQQKVGKYRVDFYIPKQDVVVEVDGSLYHQDMFKGDREATIQFSLGLATQIVHIPAETIGKDIHIIKKIMRKLNKLP